MAIVHDDERRRAAVPNFRRRSASGNGVAEGHDVCRGVRWWRAAGIPATQAGRFCASGDGFASESLPAVGRSIREETAKEISCFTQVRCAKVAPSRPKVRLRPQRKARKRAGGQNPAQVRLAIPFALHDAVQITARFSFFTIRKLLTAGPGVDCFAAV